MLELTDSSALRGDPEQMRRRLAVDGYLFLRGLLDPVRVLEVRAAVLQALDDAGWLVDGYAADAPVPSSRAVPESKEGFFEAYLRIQQQQVFHELGLEQVVMDLLGQIYGDDVLLHPRKIARVSMPRDTDYTPPHQDFPLIQGSVDALTMWVPLGSCPRELGGLRVLRGSHAAGLRPVTPMRGPGGLGVAAEDTDPEWSTTDYRAGDVILFSSLTVHGALPNELDVLRLSADYRYQPLRDPVCAGSLEPHYRPVMPMWDGLTEGWTSLRSITVPGPVTLTDQLPALDPGLVAPPSRLLELV